jgi:hypothetical protein
MSQKMGSIEAFKADVVDDERAYEDIRDTADVVRSLAVSLREAAFRRDAIHLRIHRAEFRREVSLLLGLIRDIAPLEGELTEAKSRKAGKR